ncbi:MAG TPA: hypothetical protein VFC22_01895 [Solirubrobacteraceae bacterium]|nr:hypothetical protein [Solirubrobacteraceae bacterium]
MPESAPDGGRGAAVDGILSHRSGHRRRPELGRPGRPPRLLHSPSRRCGSIRRPDRLPGASLTPVGGYGRVEPHHLPEVLRVHATDAEQLVVAA